MPTPPERKTVIGPTMLAFANHLGGLSDNEWIQAQNGMAQRVVGDGFTIDFTLQTDEARSRELAAISRSTVKPASGQTRTPEQEREELAARVAAANAEQQRTSGIPLGSPPKKGFTAPEVIHDQNAESVEQK